MNKQGCSICTEYNSRSVWGRVHGHGQGAEMVKLERNLQTSEICLRLEHWFARKGSIPPRRRVNQVVKAANTKINQCRDDFGEWERVQIGGHHGEEPKKSISYLQRLDNRTLFLCRNSARSSYSSGSRPPGSYSWILQLMALQSWDSNSYWIKSYALLKIVGLNCQKKPMIGSWIGRNSKKKLFCGWEDYSRLTGLDIGWRGALEVWWEWTVRRCKVLWSGLY